jgi:hypothetical protein
VRRKFANLGQDFFPAEQTTPAALAAFQKAEIEQRWPIIKAAASSRNEVTSPPIPYFPLCE